MSSESPETAISPTAEELARKRGIDDRLKMGKWFGRAFGFLFLVTVIWIAFLGVILWRAQPSNNPTATMAFGGLIQIVLGMTTGYICIFMGLMMTWYGIDAAYSLDAAGSSGDSKGNIALKSASPGLVFAVGGMILVVTSLYKVVVYKETGNSPTFVAPTVIDDSPSVTPDPPPPIGIE